MDAGREGERAAQALLRSSVLNDPSQAEAAWDILLSACIEFATTRTGATRIQLQALLIAHGIALKVPRSYRGDIERLREYSRHTLDARLPHHRPSIA